MSHEQFGINLGLVAAQKLLVWGGRYGSSMASKRLLLVKARVRRELTVALEEE